MDEDEYPPTEEREAPSETVETPITVTVMPSLGDQLDEAGKGETGLRQSIALADDPETGERLGELMIDMGGRVWFNSEEGPRVTFTAAELAQTALDAIEGSDY